MKVHDVGTLLCCWHDEKVFTRVARHPFGSSSSTAPHLSGDWIVRRRLFMPRSSACAPCFSPEGTAASIDSTFEYQGDWNFNGREPTVARQARQKQVVI
ncbi:conserved hypothetical protein [Burkholderia pseudomallei 1106b]|uniref:Uncharacterized protein n=4 Tax=Burkholderia pseudomallei TaxID=28450 RepID=A0A0E1W772_BURPE|nr:conserved hypothetical protein [Burkholderia pseudomallei 668]ABN92837.2 conserved hypothetical protein [Burkholderia pseudomallei 1106a]EES22580.1 conserved hypothetical protein [Burkholderia pseudomallei 1106b]EET05447.1 conserved hypothetical protein [Burkholderia pseudomallei 1710a]PNW98951.1 hypothetical protein CF649_25000 [Burkholderia sp. 136(2017)]PNX12006.1 hypothetical protein CF650_26915 [Burkholderia sp. 129]PNX35294.1 hypothetical protein CF648_25005 [Burkholderia sp. 137]